MKYFILFVVIALRISDGLALTSSSIEGCPPLLPRLSPPKGVYDLRADDIKVIAALEDSIIAGFVAKGIQNNNISSPDTSVEHRGVSWAGGGDDSELTIPNFIKHYNPKVKGASVGVHKESCSTLICLPQQYQTSKDQLNAAKSGATVLSLQLEIDYLFEALKQFPGIDYINDWKLITLQIGSNDQCLSCTDDYADLLSAENFGREIDIAIDRIRTNIPHVVINLVNGANITNVHDITKGQSYCMPFDHSDLILNSLECPCFANEETRKIMDRMAAGYTAQISQVYEKYKRMGGDDFGIMYSPDNCDFSNWPVQAFSNFDCFHPSVLGHQFTAKSIWNSMFKPLNDRPLSTPWNPDLEIHCPNETDRLQLD